MIEEKLSPTTYPNSQSFHTWETNPDAWKNTHALTTWIGVLGILSGFFLPATNTNCCPHLVADTPNLVLACPSQAWRPLVAPPTGLAFLSPVGGGCSLFCGGWGVWHSGMRRVASRSGGGGRTWRRIKRKDRVSYANVQERKKV